MIMYKSKLLFAVSVVFVVSSFCGNCAKINNIRSTSNDKIQLSQPFDSTSADLTFSSSPGDSFASVESRYVIAETYFQNGKFQPLYSGPPFPLVIDTQRLSAASLIVTLKGINTFKYELMYNNTDGLVSNVKTLSETSLPGKPEQMATESKVKNIIAKCQQIASESDGRIQFMTDNGSTRISSDKKLLVFPHATRSLLAYPTPSNPSYPAYYGASYPAASVFPPYSNFPAASVFPPHSNFPAASVSPPFHSVPHPYAFAPVAVETRRLVPATYFRLGRFEHLYPFPIMIYTERRYEHGASLTVTLKALNTIQYRLMYNVADGIVTSVIPLSETRITGSPQQIETESKIKNIIANCQQIAFELDGRIQFITDYGSTRISFDV